MTGVRRLAVFRFDRDPLVCRDRVADIRAFNPGVRIHGLYGGERPAPAPARWVARQLLGLDALYVSPHEGRWNWQHADLALLEWFRSMGRHEEFDVLHLLEWDLAVAAPLAEVYAPVPVDAVGLTCLTPIDQLIGRWEWVDGERRLEWHGLLEHAARTWGPLPEEHLACLGGGPSLPRAFLEAYSAVAPTELGNDELRLPLAAACLGFDLADTGFRTRWFDSPDAHVFDVGGRTVDVTTVHAQLADRDGRRVFHPVRQRVRLSRLVSRW